jgi:hypothetical protein
MKEYLVVTLTGLAVVFLAVFAALSIHPASKLGDAGFATFYTSPTQATSSVGLYTPVKLVSNSGSQTYVSVCNTSPTSTNNLLLEFDATSTATGLSAPARLVPGNSCYDMTLSNMFLGNLYGIFSANTATVETLVK